MRFLSSGVFAALVTAGFLQPAAAQTVQYMMATGSYGPALTDFNGITSTLNVAKFNPSLGTLDSVNIVISTTIAGSASLTTSSTPSNVSQQSFTANAQVMLINPFGTDASCSASAPTFASCYTSGDYLTGADANIVSLTGAAVFAGGTLNFNASATTTTAVSLTYGETPFQATDSATLADFTGTGSNTFQILTRTDTQSSLSGNFTLSQTTDASVTATVTYGYTAAATVPEPASFAVFGLALAGLGVALRRRARR